MKRSFPKSYPYFNEHGLAFTQSTLELAAKYFLNLKPPKTLDIGLELAYIMLWTMSKATDHVHFIKLTHSMVLHAIRRRPKSTVEMSTEDIILTQILDEASYGREDAMLNKVDVERIIGPPSKVTEIAEMRSRDRTVMIEKLKQKWSS